MGRPRKNTKKKAVVKKDNNLPSTEVMNFEDDSGAGFENADSDAYSIPYLIVLQKNSPQVDEDDSTGKYIPGAKAGMLFNTVTEELFEEATICPVYYQRLMVEWVPRDAGGGFRGSFSPDDPKIADARRGEDGRFVLENGNYLADTRYHFVLIIKEDGTTEPAVIALTSTQIKKSRNWMTQMNSLKLKGKNGKIFTPPSFSHKYTVTTIGESNDKGSWKGWKFSMDALLTQDEMGIYQAAKEFRKAIMKGSAQVTPPPSQDEGDEVAF